MCVQKVEPDFDESDITCAHVQYTYTDNDGTATGAEHTFGPVTLHLGQGQLIALQAKHRGPTLHELLLVDLHVLLLAELLPANLSCFLSFFKFAQITSCAV